MIFFSAPDETIVEIFSETPLGNVAFLRQRNLFSESFQKLRWEMLFLRQRKLFSKKKRNSAGKCLRDARPAEAEQGPEARRQRQVFGIQTGARMLKNRLLER